MNRVSQQTDAARPSGILLMVHPATGSVLSFRRGEGELARTAILDGYEPVGPRGQEAAKIIRARLAA